MAITIKKNLTLQGVITINESVPVVYEYTLVLPEQNYQTSLPNALDNQTLEEIYIHVDHDNPTTIILPPISKLKGAWNPKIYITKNLVGEVPIPTLLVKAFSSETGSDTINGSPSRSFTNTKQTLYFHAVENNMWMCLDSRPPVL
jgi:hypothetical protein